ncbi:aconitase X swivel domain-containing protein [Prosthecomicrobium sp. N25]|uniref:aconitase X swivel domain-containing protein n=1 Tax=Prosthecomicrobium sp. N25 TaxID=3129254 RepID=UPI003076B201
MTALRLDVLVPGTAVGDVLRLTAPLSFWGGVDPATGTITDVRHPEHGRSVAGRILAVPETRGSSSSSSIMLELIHAGRAPAALVLGSVDAILVLGVLVAREMGLPHPPVYALPAAALAGLPGRLAIDAQGLVTDLEPGGAEP